MNGGSAFRHLPTRWAKHSRARSKSATANRRLFVESLEDRRLLASMTDLSLNASEHRGSSLIVQFRDGTSSPGSLAAYIVTTNLGQEWSLTPGMRRVELDPNADWDATLAAYKQDPNVQFAEPDYRVSLQLLPNDPGFDQTWGLNNTGQIGGSLVDADIDAPEAWDVTTGSTSTIVAVIDTGVDYNHPDLYENIWVNQGEIPASRSQNFTDIDGDGLITFRDLNDPVNQGPFKITDVNGDGRIDGSDVLAPMKKTGGQDNGSGGWKDGSDNDKNGRVDDFVGYNFVGSSDDPMDDHFHGTHVAGTIGAIGDNGVGVAGVNWHVQIMPLKFLDASGGGYESDAIAALNYAVANGAVISNNSWGGGGFSSAFQTAIQNAANHGHIFVAAAGNDGWNNDQDPFYPASYNVNNVVSVAATDPNDALAWFSNYGSHSVDLAAPGVGIYSTFPTHVTQAMSDENFLPDYGTISGTSMATPHVTGVMALVRSLHPDWSYTQVIQQVLDTVDPVDGAAKTITGGRLNAAAAVGNPAPAPPDSTSPHVVNTDPSGVVNGTVDHVRLQFSEAIDATTFSIDDVISMTGPDGLITVGSVVPVAGSNRQFDILFAAQTTLGDYSLVIGSDISDLFGNRLDQDGDGIGGEDPDDDVTVSFQIADVVGFPSTDVPAPISWGSGTQSFLSIDQDIQISDLNVLLNISYPFDFDLRIYLTSPSGTTVTLSYENGGMDADYLDTIFDDEASTSVTNGFAPFAGSYRPEGSLSDFDGQSAAGTWTLYVEVWFNSSSDGLLYGDGFINSWSLQIDGDGGGPPPPPPPPPPGDNPPIAGDDALQGEMNTRLAVSAAELLANDFDPDGDPLSITFVGTPVGGAVSLGSDQLITFTPDQDFTGLASFQYIVSDGHHLALGNVSVDIQAMFQWHNSAWAEDVNHDEMVSAKDALILIDLLNARRSGPLVSVGNNGGPDDYLDVVPDNFLGTADALEVINYLNSHHRNQQPTTVTAVSNDAEAAAVDQSLMMLLVSDDGDGAALGQSRNGLRR